MIAVISDVHGNYPALQAVIAEIEKVGCDKIISLGDVAGYYCQINECIELLRKKNIQNIMGNHDYYMVYNQQCPRSNSANKLLDYQRGLITPENLLWLGGSVSRLDFGATSYVHGGWRDPLDEYLLNLTEEYFKEETASYFFSGHTHIQASVQFTKTCYCNPGSVGQPRDGDPRSAFALFDGENIYLKRVEYDIDRIARAMEENGFGKYYYEGLYSGIKIGGQPSQKKESFEK